MPCPVCGKESAPNANFCSACGAATLPGMSTAVAPVSPGRLVRPRSPRMIAGVCAGFAQHFGWDVALVRVVVCVFTLLTTGVGLLCYLAAWVLLPEAPVAGPTTLSAYPAAAPAAYRPGYDPRGGTGA